MRPSVNGHEAPLTRQVRAPQPVVPLQLQGTQRRRQAPPTHAPACCVGPLTASKIPALLGGHDSRTSSFAAHTNFCNYSRRLRPSDDALGRQAGCAAAAGVRSGGARLRLSCARPPRVLHAMADSRDRDRGQQRRGLDYSTLQAHGLMAPKLVEHAAFVEPPAVARAASPPETEAAVQLVKNEAGRWQLTRALGEVEPPPAALKRPGADEAAALRKRKARATAPACRNTSSRLLTRLTTLSSAA